MAATLGYMDIITIAPDRMQQIIEIVRGFKEFHLTTGVTVSDKQFGFRVKADHSMDDETVTLASEIAYVCKRYDVEVATTPSDTGIIVTVYDAVKGEVQQ